MVGRSPGGVPPCAMIETSQRTDDRDEGSASERFVDLVRRQPWIDPVVRMGWLSRGLVYVVVGLTAMSVAVQSAPTKDEASPSGALGRIASVPAGRVLLGVLFVGMVLYIIFQLFSLVLIEGNDFAHWWRRAGHLLAAAAYSMFAWSAFKVVLSGEKSSGSSLVEVASRAVLQNTAGRWLLGAAGVVTIGVGGYFVYRHVVQRGFVDGLTGIDDSPGDNDAPRGAIVVAGVVGWMGRAVVIALIGFFVIRAAVNFDPDDARGFDRALRQTAGSTTGSLFVLACGIGLLSYGVFCIASHRHRTIRDNESD